MGAKNNPALRDDPPVSNPLVINNNDIVSLMKTALANMQGGATIETEDLSDFIDGGKAYSAITEVGKEQFYKALIAQGVKNVFTDTAYNDRYDDPFYEDSRKFGAIVQMIHAEAPEVQASHAWQTFVSGTTKLGEYTIYTCMVESQLYGLSSKLLRKFQFGRLAPWRRISLSFSSPSRKEASVRLFAIRFTRCSPAQPPMGEKSRSWPHRLINSTVRPGVSDSAEIRKRLRALAQKNGVLTSVAAKEDYERRFSACADRRNDHRPAFQGITGVHQFCW